MQDRAQQLAIVQRMIDAGETEQNIAAVIQHFKTQPAPEKKPAASHPYAQLSQSLGDVLIGALKGGGETAINLGRMLHSVPGVSAVVDKLYGQEGLSAGAFDAAKQAYTQPTNTAQSIGKGAEQVAELFGAGGVVNTATRGLRLGARVAAEGAAGAGMNAAQGQSATAGAVVGAGVPVLSRGARLARELFAGAGASPAVRDAVEWGVSQGIPIDAATATGAPIVRAIQGAADATPLGGVVASQARNRASEALTSTGQRLANAVSDKPSTLLSAGESMQTGLAAKIAKASKEADSSYEALRRIEGQNSDLPSRGGVVRPEDLRVEAGAPVRASAPGTKFSDLLPEEQAAVRSLHMELEAQPFVRGGVVDTGTGEYARGAAGLQSSSRSSQSYQAQRGSNLMQNQPNADAFRDIGGSQTGSDMAKRLQSYIEGGRPSAVTDRALNVAQRVVRLEKADPLRPLQPGTGSALSAITDPVERVAERTGTRDILRSIQQTLKREGDLAYESFAGTGELDEILSTAAGMRKAGASPDEVMSAVSDGLKAAIDWKAPSRGMVVDLATARERLKPVYDRMMRSAEIAQPMGAEARALQAMDRLMRSEGQHAPLSVVDDALSDLKGVLRSNPDKLGKGAGALNSVVASLDAQVMAAAKRAGPEAVSALQNGRAATVRKYIAADLADRLSGEPAQAAGKLVNRADTSVGLLRDLAKQSPESLPQVGRAVVDDLLDAATQEGGFGGGAGLFKKWQNLGDETKALLFKPEIKKDLDRFFLLAKRMGESPNPSQSATMSIGAGSGVMTFLNPATGIPLVLGAGALSKLLHSQKGAQMLTALMSTPKTSSAYPGMIANLSRVAGLEASQAIGGSR